MKSGVITILLGLLCVSGCLPFSYQGSASSSKYDSWNNQSTTDMPLKPIITSSSYNEENSILSSDKCLAYKKQVALHETACQKHYDTRTEIKKCVIRRLIQNNFTGYERDYCGK